MSVPSHSRRGLARVSGARPDHVEVDHHNAEPVIGRAFARPIGSCGLQLRSLCALVGTLTPSLVELRRTSRFAYPANDDCELLRIPRKRGLDR